MRAECDPNWECHWICPEGGGVSNCEAKVGGLVSALICFLVKVVICIWNSQSHTLRPTTNVERGVYIKPLNIYLRTGHLFFWSLSALHLSP